VLTFSLIDHEAFILYSVAITFFALGVVGMIGSDDLFCCFILGNAMTWDDFFREESEKEAFQECIDSVLNTVRQRPSQCSLTALRAYSSSSAR